MGGLVNIGTPLPTSVKNFIAKILTVMAGFLTSIILENLKESNAFMTRAIAKSNILIVSTIFTL